MACEFATCTAQVLLVMPRHLPDGIEAKCTMRMTCACCLTHVPVLVWSDQQLNAEASLAISVSAKMHIEFDCQCEWTTATCLRICILACCFSSTTLVV